MCSIVRLLSTHVGFKISIVTKNVNQCSASLEVCVTIPFPLELPVKSFKCDVEQYKAEDEFKNRLVSERFYPRMAESKEL